MQNQSQTQRPTRFFAKEGIQAMLDFDRVL